MACSLIFFNYEKIANITIDYLAHPKKYDKPRKAARETIVKNYDLKNGLPTKTNQDTVRFY